MRFTLSAAATLAAIGISSAAPATRNAPAPAPAAEPAPAPAPYVAPAPYSAPAPSYAATNSSEGEASRAPLAPVSDAIHFNNPARNYSIAEILETPHLWYGREAVAIEANAADTTATGIAVLSPFFVAFRNATSGAEQDGLAEAIGTPGTPLGTIAPKPEGRNGDGRLAVGYMTPAWAAGLDLAFFQSATDPNDDAEPRDRAATASYAMDRLGMFGSMAFGDASLYGRADWVTGENGSWSTEDRSGRDWDFGIRAGYRTYVPGSEGLAYDAYASYTMNYLRPSGTKDPEYTNLLTIGLDYGTRRTRDGIQFLWGANSFLSYADGKDDPDYGLALSTQPNLSLEIAAFKYWTLKGGAAMEIAYALEDNNMDDPSDIRRTTWTFRPEAMLGLRFARSRWAAEADVTQLLADGPYILSGTENVMGRFAITCDFGR